MEQFQLENLSFAFPESSTRALDSVSFTVHHGEYICICGKSGSGKTTLLKHLKSALTPFGSKAGRVLFNGIPLDEVSPYDQSRFIGFVMQNPDAQIVTDSVWHELAFGLENLGIDQPTMRLRVAEMASYFGIESWFHKNVNELSGGQKQLLNLASIMALQPSVLILDEPTSQLDPIAASDFLNTLRKINLELGTTILITEHRLEDVFAAADRILVMDRGRIVLDGSPQSVAHDLYVHNADLACALPAPIRIYNGVIASTKHVDGASLSTPPITVREGRTWLLDYVIQHPACQRFLPVPELFTTEDGQPVIRIEDVWFRYEKNSNNILKGVTLEVPHHALFAIMGGNGSGKSTLLKAICGISYPQRGNVSVLGKRLKDWKGNSLFQNGLAMLPQDPQSLFVKKTVFDDLCEMVVSESDSECADRINAVAVQCEIDHLLDQHPFDLSGGEQQRVALAKVLLCNPRVLLLDEPTKGIDAFFKQKLGTILQSLLSQGVTIVMVSHDVEFCAQYATLVSLFFDGAVMATNTPRSFFSENSFYTTAANRMSREVFVNAITDEDVIELCLS